MKSYLLARQYFILYPRFCHIRRNSYGIIFQDGISSLNNDKVFLPIDIRNMNVATNAKAAAIEIIHFAVIME